MNRNVLNAVVKSLIVNATAVAAAYPLNQMLDKKLAKSKNPGMVNKFMRWNLRVGRKPTWIASNLIGQAVLAGVNAHMQEAMIRDMASTLQHPAVKRIREIRLQQEAESK